MKRRQVARNITDQRHVQIPFNSDNIEDKIRELEHQLKLIDENAHPDQISYLEKVETWVEEQQQRLQAVHESLIEETHNEYIEEMQACDKDLENEKKRVQEIIFSVCDDLKSRMEDDKKNIELTTSGDVLEHKPQSTRKLRRRGQYGNNVSMNNSSLLSEVILNSSRWHPNPRQMTSPQSNGNEYFESQEVSVETYVNEIASVCSDKEKLNSSNLFGSLSLNLNDETLLPTIVMSLKNQGSITMATILNEAATQDNSHWLEKYPFLSVAVNAVASNSGFNVSYNSNGPSFAGISTKKRRLNPNSSQAQLNLQLNENDIYADLNLIHRAGGKGGNSAMNTRKQHQAHQMQHQYFCPSDGIQNTDVLVPSSVMRSNNLDHHYRDSSSLQDSSQDIPRPLDSRSQPCWIDDGRLYYKQKCFQQGFPVVLEGRDGSVHGCVGNIHLIGAQEIAIRRSSDHGITKVTVQQLKSGRLKLWIDDK